MTSRTVQRLYNNLRMAISAGVGVSDSCWGVRVEWFPHSRWVVMVWKGPNGGLFSEGAVRGNSHFMIFSKKRTVHAGNG